MASLWSCVAVSYGNHIVYKNKTYCSLYNIYIYISCNIIIYVYIYYIMYEWLYYIYVYIYVCVYNIIILYIYIEHVWVIIYIIYIYIHYIYYIYTSFPHKTLGGRNLAAPRSRHWSALHLVSRPSAWSSTGDGSEPWDLIWVGKPLETHRKTIGKWENHRKTIGKWENHGKTIGKP